MENQTLSPINATFTKIYFGYSIFLIVSGSIGNLLILILTVYKQLIRDALSRGETSMSFTKSVRRTQTQRRPTKFRMKSEADYLLFILLCFEFICVWLHIFRYAILLGTDYDIRDSHHYVCTVQVFSSMAGINICVALMCIFSAHRMLSLRWPLATKRRINRRILTYVIFASIAFCLLKHIPVFFAFRLELNAANKLVCQPTANETHKKLITSYNMIEFLTHSMLGYSLLIIFDIFLYHSLRRSSAQRKKLESNSAGAAGTRQKSNITATKIIFAMGMIQVISTLPYFFTICVERVIKIYIIPVEYQFICNYAFVLLIFTNNAFNYFVILALSNNYRQAARRLFLKLCSCARKSARQRGKPTAAYQNVKEETSLNKSSEVM